MEKSEIFYELTQKQYKSLLQRVSKTHTQIKRVTLYRLICWEDFARKYNHKDVNNKYEFIINKDIYQIKWASENVRLSNTNIKCKRMTLSKNEGEIYHNQLWFYDGSDNNSKENALSILINHELSSINSYNNKIKKCESRVNYLKSVNPG